jgi:YbbR domain-containing protein
MKINFNLNKLFNNDKFVLLFSFCVSVLIWLAVVINVSPATTRVIKDVKVVIDNTVPSQFGLEVFGESEFTVDVTVKGKKYLISPATLSADDIVVTAQTSSVDSAGKRTLQLKAESASGRTDYSIASVSMKTIEVYFDIAKTIQMVIEPNVVADGFSVVREGYTCGDINLSETSVTITGPSTEINRVEKVVAELEEMKERYEKRGKESNSLHSLCCYNGMVVSYKHTIDIVKRGGVE